MMMMALTMNIIVASVRYDVLVAEEKKNCRVMPIYVAKSYIILDRVA